MGLPVTSAAQQEVADGMKFAAGDEEYPVFFSWPPDKAVA